MGCGCPAGEAFRVSWQASATSARPLPSPAATSLLRRTSSAAGVASALGWRPSPAGNATAAAVPPTNAAAAAAASAVPRPETACPVAAALKTL